MGSRAQKILRMLNVDIPSNSTQTGCTDKNIKPTTLTNQDNHSVRPKPSRSLDEEDNLTLSPTLKCKNWVQSHFKGVREQNDIYHGKTDLALQHETESRDKECRRVDEACHNVPANQSKMQPVLNTSNLILSASSNNGLSTVDYDDSNASGSEEPSPESKETSPNLVVNVSPKSADPSPKLVGQPASISTSTPRFPVLKSTEHHPPQYGYVRRLFDERTSKNEGSIHGSTISLSHLLSDVGLFRELPVLDISSDVLDDLCSSGVILRMSPVRSNRSCNEPDSISAGPPQLAQQLPSPKISGSSARPVNTDFTSSISLRPHNTTNQGDFSDVPNSVDFENESDLLSLGGFAEEPTGGNRPPWYILPLSPAMSRESEANSGITPKADESVPVPRLSPDKDNSLVGDRSPKSPNKEDEEFMTSHPGTSGEEKSSQRTRKYTPPEKLTKKRVSHPKCWLARQAKEALDRGEEHLNKFGKLIRGRSVQEDCGLSCRYKCRDRVTEDNRKRLFDEFWKKTEGRQSKWEFISRLVKTFKTKNNSTEGSDLANTQEENQQQEDGKGNKILHKEDNNEIAKNRQRQDGIEGEEAVDQENATEEAKPSRRAMSREYYFRIAGNFVRVCKTMFLSTFDIQDGMVETSVSKLGEGGHVSSDKRMGQNDRRICEERLDSVREHIRSFSIRPSHYVRAQSNKLYLEDDHIQSVADMHQLYLTWMKENKPQVQPVCERQYRDIFNNEFNISFLIPKKDQCDVCTSHRNGDGSEDKNALEVHRDNIEMAEELMKKDAQDAKKKENSHLCVTCFDYEKTLIAPRAYSSCFYYMTKLAVNNFTVGNVGEASGTCFVYDETIAKKGGNEVASFLLHYYEKIILEKKISEIRSYSDNCPGQNKNKQFGCLLIYLAMKYGVKITHRYLEKGHTYNYADTYHSLIERKSKNQTVYTPSHWYDIIRKVKKTKQPIIVVEVTQDMVLNFAELAAKLNLTRNTDSEQVPWTKIKEIAADGSRPNELQYKTEYEGRTFSIALNNSSGHPAVNIPTFKLQNVYEELLPLKYNKYRDLEALCGKKAIPPAFAPFFLNLPHEDKPEKNSKTTKTVGITQGTNRGTTDKPQERSNPSLDVQHARGNKRKKATQDLGEQETSLKQKVQSKGRNKKPQTKEQKTKQPKIRKTGKENETSSEDDMDSVNVAGPSTRPTAFSNAHTMRLRREGNKAKESVNLDGTKKTAKRKKEVNDKTQPKRKKQEKWQESSEAEDDSDPDYSECVPSPAA